MKTEIQLYNQFVTDRFGNIKYKDYDKPMFRDRMMKTFGFQRYVLGQRFVELGQAIKEVFISYFKAGKR